MGCSYSIQSDDNLYVIAPIFNPSGFNTRIKLYNEFAERLKTFKNVILYTIECVFGDQKFSVTNEYDKNHIQIRTSKNNISWVKENLINIAVNSLPQSSKYIAWIDADIEFPIYSRWVYEAIEKFKQGYKVLQLFSEVELLGPSQEVLETNKSFGYHIATNNWQSYAHPGMAWAMTKKEFIKLGGLYDMNPVGSSDLHFAHGLIGNIKATIKDTLSDGYKKSVCLWADRLTQIVGKTMNEYMKTVGYVDVKIKHHYHGNKNDRQYVERWNILEKHNFEPNTFYNSTTLIGGYIYPMLREIRIDILQSFRNDLLEYFNNRKEDNIVVKHEIQNNTNPKIVYSKSPPKIIKTSNDNRSTKGIRSIPRANKKFNSKVYDQSYITPENISSIYCDNNNTIYSDYEHYSDHGHCGHRDDHEHKHYQDHNNNGFSSHHPSY